MHIHHIIIIINPAITHNTSIFHIYQVNRQTQ